jgi:hypothetical protein
MIGSKCGFVCVGCKCDTVNISLHCTLLPLQATTQKQHLLRQLLSNGTMLAYMVLAYMVLAYIHACVVLLIVVDAHLS